MGSTRSSETAEADATKVARPHEILALGLGLASVVLLIVGFVEFGPMLFLAAIVGAAATVSGVRSARGRRGAGQASIAVSGAVLGVLAVVAVGFIFISFAVSPPE